MSVGETGILVAILLRYIIGFYIGYKLSQWVIRKYWKK